MPIQRLKASDPVARILRQEVHFLCPVCHQSPFLTYHHFDPTWAERNHNEPEGIIAICISCHTLAEGGKWSKEELHGFKRSAQKAKIDLPGFIWKVPQSQKIIYDLGGNIAVGDTTMFGMGVDGRNILRESTSPDGIILFSLDIFDENGKVVLEITENSLNAEASGFFDMRFSAHGNHIIIRKKDREVTLDLQLRRLSFADLITRIEKERVTSSSHPNKHLPAVIREYLSSAAPPPLDEGFKQYVHDESVDADGNVIMIDIHQALLYDINGRRMLIKDGITITS